MPPKRRRTITKPYTALDSLRAKIHSFADTADEEQLREVARLVERLSISNRGPFRLLELPHKLLEYTAQRYFTRHEAAPILPVNRVFNDLFANSVWRFVKFDNMRVNDCSVSPSMLMKNFRRIRTVDLVSFRPDSFVSGYFPFATVIAFDIRDGMEIMFTLHLEQMKCLRCVILIVNEASNSVIDAAAIWIDDSRRSGHVRLIVIRARYCPGRYYGMYSSLASLIDRIKSKKRIRLDCGSLQLLPASVVQCMPASLTRLILSQGIPRGCCGEINKQVFGIDPDSVFVHLRTLSVQVCCNKSGLYDFQSFVPERFPVLSYLAVIIPAQSCAGDADIRLATMFSNKQWPSITGLELIGDYTVVPKAGRLLLRAMPALQCCAFLNIAGIDISPDPDRCLAISGLSLAYTALELSNLRGKLVCLVCLELNDMCIDLNPLQFMASCTRLVEIKLTDCNIMDDATVALSGYPCNSVRKVVISQCSDDLFTDRIAHLLPAFPDLRILDLTHIRDVEKRISFVLKCPAIKILA
ncbi:hypothetical protein GQ42DRAFT_160498 [Ramicandelaber brevisporus]|nr:hypothetical protein GQ42DRAFT_160498 [Ramicandelaber brevisporus]